MPGFNAIVVACRDTPSCKRALESAAHLCAPRGRVSILSVVERVPRFAGTVGEVEEHVRQQADGLRDLQAWALTRLDHLGVTSRTAVLEFGHPVHLISGYAERHELICWCSVAAATVGYLAGSWAAPPTTLCTTHRAQY